MISKKLLAAKSAGNFLALCVLCFLFFFLSSVYRVHAQPFSFYTTFNPEYDFNYVDPGNQGQVASFYEEADGSILVAGAFYDFNHYPPPSMVRLFQYVTIDTSY